MKEEKKKRRRNNYTYSTKRSNSFFLHLNKARIKIEKRSLHRIKKKITFHSFWTSKLNEILTSPTFLRLNQVNTHIELLTLSLSLSSLIIPFLFVRFTFLLSSPLKRRLKKPLPFYLSSFSFSSFLFLKNYKTKKMT